MIQRRTSDRDVIHAVSVHYTLNMAVWLAHVVANTFVLFIFPLYGLPHPGAAVFAVFAVSCLSNGLFSVLHEAIHRSLAPAAKLPLIGISANDVMGRIIGVCFGSPFDFIASAHLTHHSVNRTQYEHPDVYDEPMTASAQRSFLIGYYFFLLGGLYKAEFFVPMILWLPRRIAQSLLARFFAPEMMADQALRRIYGSPYHLRAIRIDALIILAAVLTSVGLYGHYWWILAIHFLVRAFLVSFLDYTYHYASPLDDRLHGYNLALPKVAAAAILNFNYHGIHHRFPALPWRSLARVFNDEALVFDNDYVTQAVSQLKGPMTREGLRKLLDMRKAQVSPF